MVNIYIKALIFMGVALFMLEAVSQLSNTEYSYPHNLRIHIYISIQRLLNAALEAERDRDCKELCIRQLGRIMCHPTI